MALSLVAPVLAQSGQPMPVVTTFSILGDIAKRIGGEHISLTTLVGPNGDAHVYQPTPADARAASEAQVLIVNGLEFEGWLDRLIDASDFNGMKVVATADIEPIAFKEDGDHHEEDEHQGHEEDTAKEKHVNSKHEDEEGHDDHHGAFDPHAWQSLENAISYVNRITASLAESNPKKATDFYQNRATYVAEIEMLDREIRALMTNLPEGKRTVVTSHDAFGYFAVTYGLNFEAPQGMSTESEASAKDVANLIEQIRNEGISAVFIETITDNRLLEQIARETGVTIGGTLYSDALSDSNGPASTYLDMMRHNAMTLTKALSAI